MKTCASCNKPIPPARLAAMPNAVYCVPCQSLCDVYLTPPDYAMGTGGEGDDETRVIEQAWGHISEVRRPRTLKHQRVLSYMHITS